MDSCEVKFGELTRTVATKNVTISALVALFNTHNAQTCWLRGLSGTYVVADENGSFPQLESFGVAENWATRAHVKPCFTCELKIISGCFLSYFLDLRINIKISKLFFSEASQWSRILNP